jgi:hypothetical protein
MYTFDENIVSDLHKDARGYRPREYFWKEWKDSNGFDRQAIWDGLTNELKLEMARERQAQLNAEIKMHQRIQGTMLVGAKDEVQAIKWIMEAEEFSDIDLQYGASYFCFHFGLSYSAEKEFPIQEAINEMLSEVK